jgi:hypothetical protein
MLGRNESRCFDSMEFDAMVRHYPVGDVQSELLTPLVVKKRSKTRLGLIPWGRQVKAAPIHI